MRPANLFTAIADVLAGAVVLGVLSGVGSGTNFVLLLSALLPLVAASIFLYAGGVVLNDAFDAEIDRKERPERPIPSGKVPIGHAFCFGYLLLILGGLCALVTNKVSGLVALLLALSIFCYDSLTKHSAFWGPLSMGVCRGLNLLLGMSVVYSLNGSGFGQFYLLTVLPVIYIAAITLISQGEVVGDNKKAILIAGFMYQLVIILLVLLGNALSFKTMQALPFILLFIYLTMRPLLAAYKQNSPENIRHAVKSGVVALIVLDASIAAGFSSLLVGALVLLLLPMSAFVGKYFAVT